MNRNAQAVLDRELARLAQEGWVPRLLLHACCAPCSSYVLEYLAAHFAITVYYYNPNIAPETEYRFRAGELQRLLTEMNPARPVDYLEGPYEPARFYALSRGLEQEPEGGERCFRCYRLRLESTAQTAQRLGFAYFTTTLSISPYKNAAKLNEIGEALAAEYGVRYLTSDFKKRNGYRRSCELSTQYGLYRQDYCGCVYSQAEAAARRAARCTEKGDSAGSSPAE